MRPAIVRTRPSQHLWHIAAAVTTAACFPTLAASQPCFGTPRGASVSFERGKYQLGSSNGVNATFAGSRAAVGIDAAMREYSSNFSGQQAGLRLSLGLGPSRFQVCPGLRLNFARDTWNYEPGNHVNGTGLSAAGGVNVGLEQRVVGDFTVNPFAGASYRFAVTAFSIGAVNSENAVGGDSVSTVAIEYGLIGRYRFVYGGIAAERTTDSQGMNPVSARWILGISVAGFRGASKSAVRSSSAIDKPRR